MSIWCLLSAALETSSALAKVRSASRNSLSLIRVQYTPNTVHNRPCPRQRRSQTYQAHIVPRRPPYVARYLLATSVAIRTRHSIHKIVFQNVASSQQHCLL